MKRVIGIDVGGTMVKGVLIDLSGEVLHQENTPTNDKESSPEWMKAVRDMHAVLKEKSGCESCITGVAAPGIANSDHSAIAFMPGRLAGIENFNWGEYLESREVFVLNDAHAALMAESRFGAGKGLKNLVLLTLGTGIGGGILINGELYTGKGLMAGHLGHITLNSAVDEAGITGSPGTLEQAIGNATVGRRSTNRFDSTSQLVNAYENGDSFATWVWLDSVRKLALAICSLSNALSPDALILGGGITNAGDSLFGPLKEFLNIHEWRPGGKQTTILQAKYSDLSGAVGAAAFAIDRTGNIAT